MKPTSVIFIIISVLLACVGVLLMVTASNMAVTQGTSLFSQTGDSNNNYVAPYEIDDEKIQRLSLDVSNVTVHVFGRAAESKIELVNFPEGTFELNTGKFEMTMTEKTDFSNIVDIDNLKINFNGFRDYLHYFKYKEKDRVINIYLSEKSAIKVLKISADGDVTLDSLTNDCDFRITVGTGDVSVSNVRTLSSVTVKSREDSNITLDNITAGDIEINANKAYATMKGLKFDRSLYVRMEDGGVDYDADSFDGFKVKFRTDSGVITYGSNRVINGIYEEDLTGGEENPGEAGSSAIVDPTPAGSSSVVPTGSENTSRIEGNTVTVYLTEGDIKVY